MALSSAGGMGVQLGFDAGRCRKLRSSLSLVVMLALVQLGCTPEPESASANIDAVPSGSMSVDEHETGGAADDMQEGGVGTTTPITSVAAAPILPTTSTTASVGIRVGAVGPPQPGLWVDDLPEFRQGHAPEWPFVGVVQLWRHDRIGRYSDVFVDESVAEWWLLYLGLDDPAGLHRRHPAVPLPGLMIECLGRVALVSHGAVGLEVGGSAGVASGSVVVPWGAVALPVGEPSAVLLDEARSRPSSVPFSIRGDVVTVGAGVQQQHYAMRTPSRLDGDWWQAQVRHDGALLVMSVQPSHLRCLNGVTWISDAGTGQVLACGANTPATRLVAPRGQTAGDLVLPDPEIAGGVLDCAARLDLPWLAQQYAQVR